MSRKAGELTLFEVSEARKKCHDTCCNKCVLRYFDCDFADMLESEKLQEEVPEDE